MNCKKCGLPIDEKSNFCTNCGEKIEIIHVKTHEKRNFIFAIISLCFSLFGFLTFFSIATSTPMIFSDFISDEYAQAIIAFFSLSYFMLFMLPFIIILYIISIIFSIIVIISSKKALKNNLEISIAKKNKRNLILASISFLLNLIAVVIVIILFV